MPLIPLLTSAMAPPASSGAALNPLSTASTHEPPLLLAQLRPFSPPLLALMPTPHFIFGLQTVFRSPQLHVAPNLRFPLPCKPAVSVPSCQLVYPPSFSCCAGLYACALRRCQTPHSTSLSRKCTQEGAGGHEPGFMRLAGLKNGLLCRAGDGPSGAGGALGGVCSSAGCGGRAGVCC